MPAVRGLNFEKETPGPVLQFVVIETFTVALSGFSVFWTLMTVVAEGGTGVGEEGSAVTVSVKAFVSVTVEVLVNSSVGVGVSEGVRVDGGSFVGVKVDLMLKGVFVEVPFRVYFGTVCTPSQALIRLVKKRINKRPFKYLFWNIN